jgi:hypothetical protein
MQYEHSSCQDVGGHASLMYCLHLAIICMCAHDSKELPRWVQQLLALKMAHIALDAGREAIHEAAAAGEATKWFTSAVVYECTLRKHCQRCCLHGSWRTWG